MVHWVTRYFVWLTSVALLLGMTVTPGLFAQAKDAITQKDSKSKKKKSGTKTGATPAASAGTQSGGQPKKKSWFSKKHKSGSVPAATPAAAPK